MSSSALPDIAAPLTRFTPGILLAISLGAILGALGRESLAAVANGPAPHSFPWGTLIANISGAFLLGLFATYIDRVIKHPLFRAFWEIGLIRSFTTLSTFSLEGIHMVEAREWESFLPYVVISVLGGLLAVFLGDRLGQSISLSSGLVEEPDVRERVEKEI